jgi:hypothetical protein
MENAPHTYDGWGWIRPAGIFCSTDCLVAHVTEWEERVKAHREAATFRIVKVGDVVVDDAWPGGDQTIVSEEESE